MTDKLKGIVILGLTIVVGFSSCTNKSNEGDTAKDSLEKYVAERLLFTRR